MIVALDNTFLSLVFNPNSRPRPNPATGHPIEHCQQRVEALIDEHGKKKDTVLIPAPCLSEMLVAVPDLAQAIAEINRSGAFEVAPFDARAAIDLAEANRKAKASGDKKSGISVDWQKVKLDRQIAAIAKAHGSSVFYTDDGSQTHFAKELGLSVRHTWDLDLPLAYAQAPLWEDDPDAKP